MLPLDSYPPKKVSPHFFPNTFNKLNDSYIRHKYEFNDQTF